MKDNIENILKTTVEELLNQKEAVIDKMPPILLAIPKDKSHGDYSTNVALIFSKKLNMSPRDLANELCAKLDLALAGQATTSIAGPGFINLKLSEDAGKAIFDNLLDRGDQIGLLARKNKTVNVEYVSANPTGPLSVGHGRNAAVGDVVANMLDAAGYDVTREYYFNDAGNQMNVLARSVKTRYQQICGLEVELEEGGYQGEYIVDIARKIESEHGKTLIDSDKLDIFKKYAVDATFTMIKDTLKTMRVNHDVYFNEYTLYDSGKIEATLKRIAEHNLSYEKDGAVWYKATKFGADKDRALVKSTGEPTYRLPDIAYHIDKYERGFDKIINIFGADHIAQYPDVVSCLKALGYDDDKIDVVVYQFVTVVRDGQAVKMSTRKANFITLDDLMEEVGVDATRYFFVMRRLGSHLEFDLELATSQSLDNPVFYVQYAHARISSIFRRAKEIYPDIDPQKLNAENIDATLLSEAEEQALIRHLAQFEELIEVAAEVSEPHRITGYLEKLAELFHRYYNSHQVVVEDKQMAQARMALIKVTQLVIKRGLSIVGVNAPERM